MLPIDIPSPFMTPFQYFYYYYDRLSFHTDKAVILTTTDLRLILIQDKKEWQHLYLKLLIFAFFINNQVIMSAPAQPGWFPAGS
jgi:hypothetical protein